MTEDGPESPQRGARVLFRRLGTIAASLGAAIAIPLLGTLLPRCDGGYTPAIEALNACPNAVGLLGSPIRQSWIGFACGESESGGGSGEANWQIRVSGPLRSGTYRYMASGRGGVWRVYAAELSVGGEKYSIVPCSDEPLRVEAGGDPTGPSTRRLTAGTELSGTVIFSGGTTPVQAGDTCRVHVSPSPEEARAHGYNCHVKVACGPHVVYGFEGAGMTRCEVVDGAAVRARDSMGASTGDDPKLELDVERRTAVVEDDLRGAEWRLEITLGG